VEGGETIGVKAVRVDSAIEKLEHCPDINKNGGEYRQTD
jgi:hypothetical protein